MEPSKDRYYDIVKKYLTLVGQWPYQKPKEGLFFLTFFLFFDANILVTQVTLIATEISFSFLRKERIKLCQDSASSFEIKLTRECNHVFQAAKFFVCDSMQCIFETLPPHLLAAIAPVKIFTYQFNSRKVRSINIGIILAF